MGEGGPGFTNEGLDVNEAVCEERVCEGREASLFVRL